MELRDGYQKTEVGIIPEDWASETLGAIGNVRMCKRIFSNQTSSTGDIPFFKIGTFGKEPDAYIPFKLYSEFKNLYSYPKTGDVLISASGTIGRTVIFDGSPAYFQDSNIVWLDLNREKIGNDYLYHYYQIIKWASPEGTTISRLYNDVIRSTNIAVPPTKAEQTEIATALSDVDALIMQLEKLITKKRQIKQGAMQTLLNPFDKNGLLKDGWKEQRLGDAATLKARIGWQGLTTSEYLKTGDYFLITGTEFKNGFIDWDSCHYVEQERYKQDRNIQINPNDVLVTKDGTIGKSAFIHSVPKPATLNSGVFVIRPINKSFHPEFFYYVLMSDIFTQFLTQLCAGSTINHLYQKDFVHFKFYTPKTIEEQKEIAQIFSDMDDEIHLLSKKLEKTRRLKQGMMQSLLTGQIRLIDPTPKNEQ